MKRLWLIEEFDQEIQEKHHKDVEEVVADEGHSWSQHEDGGSDWGRSGFWGEKFGFCLNLRIYLHL